MREKDLWSTENTRALQIFQSEWQISASSPTLLKVDELRAATKTAPRAILLNRIMVVRQSGKIFLLYDPVCCASMRKDERSSASSAKEGERVEIERSRALR